jgi:hypothetical protein
MSLLKDAKAKTSTSVTTRTSMEQKKDKEVPAGADIVSSNITTETEEIENGWLITKRYDVTYRAKGSEHTDYAYFNKKWFSKTDPLTINITDKSLAEAFKAE